MASFRYVLADVFTDTPLAGQRARGLHGCPRDSRGQAPAIAREMNLSETVFVYKAEGDGHARIRIFTPVAEVPFAGIRPWGRPSSSAGPCSSR